MVSIIIPVFNREVTIEKSIYSILNQTYQSFEILVVDDGSTDKTADIVKGIDDQRIRYIYQNNYGACVARNLGIRYAKGEYIAFHDSDDVWLRDKLQIQMNIITNCDADLVFCKLNCFTSNGVLIECMPSQLDDGFITEGSDLLGIGTQTILARKKVFEDNKFDPDMPRFQEFELLYRLMQMHLKIYCIDEGLVNYYIGKDSISSNSEKMYEACKLLQEKHPDLVNTSPNTAKRLAANLQHSAFDENSNIDGRLLIRKSLEFDHSIKALLRIVYLKVCRCGDRLFF